jgi:DNA-binding response OmpR family regulator
MLGKPILIVDDDHLFAEVIAEVLRDEGYGVEPASDGYEALAVFRRVRPPLMVLDLRLPATPRTELVRLVRSREAPPPIVLTSAGLDLDGATSRLRPDASLAKPLDLEELLVLVRLL